jgi:hypothetical protein
MIFRAIAERSGFVGRIVVGLVGMAWTLATYLAVPVLVTRDVGPIDAVKESAQLFRQTWGEQVVGNFGMGWAVMLMGLSWGLVSVGMIWLGAQIAPTAAFTAVVLAVAGFVFLGLLSSALKGIYTAALYRYASTGRADLFSPDVVGNAFRPRR